jgi:hypothetical protein
MNVRVNKAQRIVLALYLLFIAYCFVWIPWSVTTTGRYGADHQRLGYGWVWAGPRFSPSTTSDAKDFSNVDQFVADSVEHNRIATRDARCDHLTLSHHRRNCRGRNAFLLVGLVPINAP